MIQYHYILVFISLSCKEPIYFDHKNRVLILFIFTLSIFYQFLSIIPRKAIKVQLVNTTNICPKYKVFSCRLYTFFLWYESLFLLFLQNLFLCLYAYVHYFQETLLFFLLYFISKCLVDVLGKSDSFTFPYISNVLEFYYAQNIKCCEA